MDLVFKNINNKINDCLFKARELFEKEIEKEFSNLENGD